MPPSLPSHTIEALCAVGRNVVNFQRLEIILKRLALLAPICAPLSELERHLQTLKAKSERLTLGGAVRKWIESAYHTEPLQDPQPDNEITISFGFVLQWRPEKLDQLSAELESLAQERNGLIHQDLAQLNFEDKGECIALSIQLNAQNDRIIRTIEVLEASLTELQDMAQRMASDERFRKLFGPARVE